MKVVMSTEGSCERVNNTNVGSWKVSLVCDGVAEVFSGKVGNRTGYEMELIALIEGFMNIKEACDVTVRVKSKTLMSAFDKTDGWLKHCMGRDWKKADGSDIQNKVLWQQVVKTMQVILPYKAEFVYDQPVISVMPKADPIPVVSPILMVKQMSDKDLCLAIGLDRFCELVSKLDTKQKTAVRKAMTVKKEVAAKAA
jgi:ribonuclease HI